MDDAQFELGKKDGYSAGTLVSGLAMSEKPQSYAVGYIAGYASYVASMEHGIKRAAYESGKLAFRYRVARDIIKAIVLDDILKTTDNATYEWFENGVEAELEDFDKD
ncbi:MULTISPECIES: DUF2623 family protein [Vibrio]|uniref:DUF2623 family protein n=1 Tax=Vibrio TaxID=662 RepID=UPI001DF4AADF|nr:MULTISPECIES: DUF2623 family protein [unclassified Vibrio]EGQ8153818.1 DUF2623 family protein [Vibrio alginolyticus]EGQ9215315.1 DUF2623 family protein [Vibrio alginolyticus]EGR2324765.1 DUF2623 family protein [Vibrio alginolyticus]EGR2355682.1 DUF2623 family protein [Vibrio alginolyticus]EGR2553315.1 DUF2623 family protein [Vibrio alginolyticus]